MCSGLREFSGDVPPADAETLYALKKNLASERTYDRQGRYNKVEAGSNNKNLF
jgi:hypothetical protein